MLQLEDVRPTERGPCLGPYEIVRRLGRGGMGDVFEARHVQLGTRVAIKVVHSSVSRDPAAARRVLREGRAAGAIRHPNVVTVFDVDTDQGAPYLVMELLEGEDLACRLRREGSLPARDAVDLLLPVISGVAAAHDAGIVHRDLKPSNVFLARRASAIDPVVVDFGISKVLHPPLDPSTSSRAVAGTALYMAPEQLRGTHEVTARSDQYTLGAVLYECVTGGTPFFDEDFYELLRAIMTAKLVPPSELNPSIPRGLDEVLLRAMDRRPEARFPHVRVFGAALLPFAGEEARRRWRNEFRLAQREGHGGFAVTITTSPLRGLVGSRWASRRSARLPIASGVGSVVAAVALLGVARSAWHPTAAERTAIASPAASPAAMVASAPVTAAPEVSTPSPAPSLEARGAAKPPAPPEREPAPRKHGGEGDLNRARARPTATESPAASVEAPPLEIGTRHIPILP